MSTANIAAALAKVQAKLPKLDRDRTVTVKQKNGDSYSYSYVTLANLTDAIMPLLAEHGLAFVALPGAGSDGKMSVRYQLMHESGEVLSGEMPISGEGGIQMIGGRITYARRYCLAAIVGVAADEDDESRLAEEQAPRTASRDPARSGQSGRTVQRDRPAGPQPPLPGEDGPPASGPGAPITDAQMRKLQASFTGAGIRERGERLAYVQRVIGREVGSSNELTRVEAAKVIDALEKPGGEPDPWTPAGGEQ